MVLLLLLALQPIDEVKLSVDYEVVDAGFPSPCADAGVCWLTWDPSPSTTHYEVLLDGQVCATIRETVGPYGGTHPPRTTLWPSPGRCLPTQDVGTLTVRACNLYGCSPISNPVDWQPIPFRCFTSSGEIQCPA